MIPDYSPGLQSKKKSPRIDPVPQSGFKGVSWNSRMKAWLAFYVTENGERKSKTFSTRKLGMEEARLQAIAFCKQKQEQRREARRRNRSLKGQQYIPGGSFEKNSSDDESLLEYGTQSSKGAYHSTFSSENTEQMFVSSSNRSQLSQVDSLVSEQAQETPCSYQLASETCVGDLNKIYAGNPSNNMFAKDQSSECSADGGEIAFVPIVPIALDMIEKSGLLQPLELSVLPPCQYCKKQPYPFLMIVSEGQEHTYTRNDAIHVPPQKDISQPLHITSNSGTRNSVKHDVNFPNSSNVPFNSMDILRPGEEPSPLEYKEEFDIEDKDENSANSGSSQTWCDQNTTAVSVNLQESTKLQSTAQKLFAPKTMKTQSQANNCFQQEDRTDEELHLSLAPFSKETRKDLISLSANVQNTFFQKEMPSAKRKFIESQWPSSYVQLAQPSGILLQAPNSRQGSEGSLMCCSGSNPPAVYPSYGTLVKSRDSTSVKEFYGSAQTNMESPYLKLDSIESANKKDQTFLAEKEFHTTPEKPPVLSEETQRTHEANLDPDSIENNLGFPHVPISHCQSS